MRRLSTARCHMTVTRSSPSTSPNCVIREDQRGARLSKPDKNLLRRIDAAVAAVMAFARFMPLPSPVAETLKHHWTAQAAERPAAPVWAPWEEHPDLVFPTQMGTPTDSTKAVRAFGSIANRAGLVGVGLHTLMHSAASALIASGAHLKVVQEGPPPPAANHGPQVAAKRLWLRSHGSALKQVTLNGSVPPSPQCFYGLRQE